LEDNKVERAEKESKNVTKHQKVVETSKEEKVGDGKDKSDEKIAGEEADNDDEEEEEEEEDDDDDEEEDDDDDDDDDDEDDEDGGDENEAPFQSSDEVNPEFFLCEK